MGREHMFCRVIPDTLSKLSVVIAKRDIWEPRVLRTPSEVQLRPVNHTVLAYING